MTEDLIDDLEAAIDFLHEGTRAVDQLEDVHALLVVTDLVGQLAAAPVLGLLDGAAQAGDNLGDLVVLLGRLLFRRFGRQDVDEFVLPV